MGYGEDIAVQHLKISDFADLYRSAYRFFPFLIGRIDGVHPHAVRHAAIHGVVDGLQPGGAFVLVAPHNPLPLLAQIAERHGESIAVSYVEEGPEAWKLKLERV